MARRVGSARARNSIVGQQLGGRLAVRGRQVLPSDGILHTGRDRVLRQGEQWRQGLRRGAAHPVGQMASL